MDLGIVIVNYNTCALLRRCLETVFASTGATFEVCVVDNNSPDDSVAMVAAEFPQVRLIANTENAGYPAANNIGLRTFGFEQGSCNGAPRYALLLNPDTEVPPDAFARMLAFADAHPGGGVFGPKLVRPDGSLDKACRRSFPTPEVSALHMLGLWRIFPKSHLFGRYNLTYLDPDEMAAVDSVVGAFMMVRRESIEQAGLLDDTFFMYGEDLDWAFRIKEAGWIAFYYPGVTVLHVKRAASRHSARAQVEFWRAMDIFYRKHYETSTARWLHCVIVSAIALRKKLVEWQVKRTA